MSSIWFSWQRLSELNWARPWVMYFLPLIPLLFLLKAFLQKQARRGLPIAVVGNRVARSWTTRLRALPPILITISLILLMVALARPMLPTNTQRRISEGIDIVLALDISESMTFTDISPNRLDAAKSVLKTFIEGRFQDRIGIVLFSGEAFTLAPLTNDYDALSSYLQEARHGIVNAEGTAIGSAIAVAVNRLNKANTKTKIMILISDGDNTAGSIDPQTSAKLAAAYGVKIYSVFVGAESKSTEDNFNKSVDVNQMQNIAKITGGRYFVASDNTNMKRIFEEINNLEKVKYLESSNNILVDVYHVYLRWAIVFLLLTFFTKVTFIGNILED